MTLECRIFRPSKNGKMSLVETKTHEEILKMRKTQYFFNRGFRRKQKYPARMKNTEKREKNTK